MNNYDFTYTRYFLQPDNEKTGIVVSHPYPAEKLLGAIPNLKALDFKFNSTAFKAKDNRDHYQYLKDILNGTQLEYLSISSSANLEEIPPEILLHPIEQLRIFGCPKIKNLDRILSGLKNLEILYIQADEITLGENFYRLPVLYHLDLRVKKIKDLEYLPEAKNLIYLHLHDLEHQHLPEGIANLSNLEEFRLTSLNQLETIPSLDQLNALKGVFFQTLPKLQTIPDDFANLYNLKKIGLWNVGTTHSKIDFPNSICQLKNLEELYCTNSPFSDLPDNFDQLNHLKFLHLGHPAIKYLPASMGALSALEEMKIEWCTELQHIPETFSQLTSIKRLIFKNMGAHELSFKMSELINLNNLVIEDLPLLETLPADLNQCPSLGGLNLNKVPKLKQLPSLGINNKELAGIEIREAAALTQLPETLADCPKLQRFSINTCGLKSIPSSFSNMQEMTNIELYTCKDLEYIPSRIINIPTIKNIRVYQCEKINDQTPIQIQDILPFLRDKVDQNLHTTIFFWLLNNFGKEELTADIRQKSIEALALNNPDIRLLILNNLAKLNPDGLSFSAAKKEKGDQVTILGKIEGTKTAIRKKLEALGLKYTTTLGPEVKFILLGRKPDLGENFWDNPRILFSEVELENTAKVENPGLLQQEDTPDEYIENLRQLLSSSDPNNEAVALELVKTNGLPSSLHVDFILVAKTSKDKNLRNKFRRFLKGKISAPEQKVLSERSYHINFNGFLNYLSHAEVAQMVVTQHRRTGDHLNTFFQVDDGSSPNREEMFQKVLPSLLEKPKYLKVMHNLTTEEFNRLLAHDIFQGQLTRIHMNSTLIKTIPEGIYKHPKLKILEINNNLEITSWPLELFDLNKLTKLTLQCRKLKHVPSEIEKLTRLKTMYIYNKEPVLLPTTIGNLPKLERAYFSGGIKNLDEFKVLQPNATY